MKFSGTRNFCTLSNLLEQSLELTPLYFYFTNARHKTQPAIACSKLTIETLEQGVKYIQS